MLFGLGAALGLAGALLQPTGCILPDYCILVNVIGNDYCTAMEGAMMWPIGSPEMATPIHEDGGFGAVRGCRCMNATEAQWLGDGVPEEQAMALAAELHEATRNRCASLVPQGFDHNCYADEIEFGPATFYDGPDRSASCIHSCAYINPPPKGFCPADPDPFECNELAGRDGGGGTGMVGTESTGTGGDTSPGIGELEVRP